METRLSLSVISVMTCTLRMELLLFARIMVAGLTPPDADVMDHKFNSKKCLLKI